MNGNDLSRIALYVLAALVILITVGGIIGSLLERTLPLFITDRYDAIIVALISLLVKSPRDDTPQNVRIIAPEPLPVSDEGNEDDEPDWFAGEGEGEDRAETAA